MNIYSIFVHIHSGVRWLALLFIVVAIVNAAIKIMRHSTTSSFKDCASNRLSLMIVHLQLVTGLLLYFISPKVIFSAASMKDGLLRFFLVEHIGIMIISVILITVGYVKSENAPNEIKKYKRIVVYYSIALLLILAAIPWPFRGLGAGWF